MIPVPFTDYVITLEMILLITVVTGAVVIYLVNYSKYYVLREVYLSEVKGDRKPRYFGRQLRYIKGKGVPKILRERGYDDIIVIQEGFIKGSKKYLAIPDFVSVKQKKDKTIVIGARGIKHDYDLDIYVPFNDYIRAQSTSEKVFYDEIKDKFSETDKKVTQATICSSRAKEWHNMVNSIPMDVELPREEGDSVIPEVTPKDSDDYSKIKDKALETKKKIERKMKLGDDFLTEIGGFED